MSNPWEEIRLADYEAHMRLDSVRQLQAMNEFMKSQWTACPARTAMLLGAAGGNGLEHVRPEQFQTLTCVDINAGYLAALRARFPQLESCLRCLRLELTEQPESLPQADLLIANLLIEYIGYESFGRAVLQAAPNYVSCVIQVNAEETNWVSDSPYLHVFDGLESIYHQITADGLTEAMEGIGYQIVFRDAADLPNGKQLVRLDYRK